MSSKASVPSGIFQGSIIGPLLFILLINNITEGITSQVKLIADDTKLFRPVAKQEDVTILQSNINMLNRNLESLGLSFNAKKCKTLWIGPKPKKINDTLTIARTNTVSVISHTDCKRDLGIFIDSGIKFHQHTDLITNKASRLVGPIRQSFNI